MNDGHRVRPVLKSDNHRPGSAEPGYIAASHRYR